jgi:hypothetical protein
LEGNSMPAAILSTNMKPKINPVRKDLRSATSGFDSICRPGKSKSDTFEEIYAAANEIKERWAILPPALFESRCEMLDDRMSDCGSVWELQSEAKRITETIK